MPLLGFKREFAEMVESGEKRQTIRAFRKDGRDPKPGDTLYLYTGLRTKAARKLGEAECSEVFGVEIDEHGCLWRDMDDALQPVRFPELGWIATNDGFASYEQLRGWFERVHGLPFRGLVIRW